MSATHILTPGVLEFWSDKDLIYFLLDDGVVYGTPKPDLVLIAQEVAVRYDHLLQECEADVEEDDTDDPAYFDS